MIAFGIFFSLIQTDANAGNSLWNGVSNQTGNISRMGGVHIGTGGSSAKFTVKTSKNGDYAALFWNSGGSGHGVRIQSGYPHKSNKVRALMIGNSKAGSVFTFWNNGKTSGLSDERLKSNIRPLKNTFNKIDKIRGVTFQWNDSEEAHIGMIAQDVESVFPDSVSEVDGYKGIDYMRFAAVLVESIKDLKEEVAGLKAKNEMLLERIEELDKDK